MSGTETASVGSSGESTALIAALDHARAMANFAADVRMRNFYFFVLITAALLAGLAQFHTRWSPVLGSAGVLTSALFFGLDVRGRGLLKRSIDQLAVLEPLVWQRASVPNWTPIPRQGGNRFVSHKWMYRTFFVVVGSGSLGVCVAWMWPLLVR